jgi:type III restriction enzyme
MELKPYQSRVIQDLDNYLTLVDQTQDYVKAYEQFWNEKGIAVGKTDVKSMPAYKDIVS